MIVETEKGKVEGVTRDGVTVFRGIPFAAPPTGQLRWEPPGDVEPWEGVRKADTFGKSCIQPVYESMDGTEPVGEQSEDCLYLNVWTTGGGHNARKPVMVWIHGGGFTIGNGIAKAYDGSSLARRGAVVVTLNYRLGFLGFFAHPALERKTPGGPVNFGLQDQIKALKWVKDNIAAFGGNPGNVTIFGQSAGAVSVLTLFCAPEAANLFHRGIAQSPYALPEASRDKALGVGVAAATRVFELGPNPSVADLRAVPANMFARLQTTPGIPMPFPKLGPVVVIDDVVLPRGVRDTFEAGDQRRVPLILGSTSHEESVLGAFGIDPVMVLELIKEHAGPEAIDGLKLLYRGDTDELNIPEDLDNPARFGGLVVRDFLFTMQVRWIADKHGKHADARRYYYGYVPEQLRPALQYGVPHGGELAFPFDSISTAITKDYKFTPADRQMASKVSSYWLTFAQTGTPSAPGQPTWWRHLPGLVDVVDWTLRLGNKQGDKIEILSDFRRTRLAKYAEMYSALLPIIGG